jgi:hypothetical protein
VKLLLKKAKLYQKLSMSHNGKHDKKNNPKVIAGVVIACLSMILFVFGIQKNKQRLGEMLRKFVAQAIYEQPDILDCDINNFSDHSINIEYASGPRANFEGSKIRWLADRSDFYMIYLSNKPILDPNNPKFVTSPEPFNPNPLNILLLDNLTTWIRKMDFDVPIENSLDEFLTVEVPLTKFYCIIVSKKGNCTPLQKFPPQTEKELHDQHRELLPLQVRFEEKGQNMTAFFNWTNPIHPSPSMELILDTLDEHIWTFPIKHFDTQLRIKLGVVRNAVCYLKLYEENSLPRYECVGHILEKNFHNYLLDDIENMSL